MKKLLNIGGGSKSTEQFPEEFGEVEHVMLDIDPMTGADIVCDAKELVNREDLKEQFDIVWSSHCLEHFPSHEVGAVISGMHHVLKPDGIVMVMVPDIREAMRHMLLSGADIIDIAYEAPNNGNPFPVSYADMMWGSHFILRSGNLHYKHHYGFTGKSLTHIMQCYGFEPLKVVDKEQFQITYVGMKREEYEKRTEAVRATMRLYGVETE